MENIERGNWFKISRKFQQNECLKGDIIKRGAWLSILGATAYMDGDDLERGQVNLTEVYRELQDSVSRSQWRAIVQAFVQAGMLEIVEVVNLGQRAGKRQIARVCNWERYQSSVTDAPSALRTASHQHTTMHAAQHADVQDEENATSEISTSHSKSSANNQHSAQSYKNKNLKEVKEDKEVVVGGLEQFSSEEIAYALACGLPNPKITQDQNRKHLGKLIGWENFRRRQIQDSWQSWYADRTQEEIEEIWRQARDQRDKTRFYWFVDELNGTNKPQKSEEGSVAEKIDWEAKMPPGTKVHHPVYGEDVIRWYWENGEAQLDINGCVVMPETLTPLEVPCLN